MNDLVDTTEMYLRTILELEEEGVPPLRARIAEALGERLELGGFLLGGGALGIITLHALINMFMTVGLLPVVGVPLPFFSYGGTSLVVDMSAGGLPLKISMRRYKFQS